MANVVGPTSFRVFRFRKAAEFLAAGHVVQSVLMIDEVVVVDFVRTPEIENDANIYESRGELAISNAARRRALAALHALKTGVISPSPTSLMSAARGDAA